MDLPLRRWRALSYIPNAWALNHVHGHPARFVTGITARQVGKTTAGAIEIDLGMIAPLDDFGRTAHVGVLAPTYGKAELMTSAYEEMILHAFGDTYYTKNINKHQLYLPENHARLTWLSADDPKSVVGYTFSKLIIDEGQDVPDQVYDKIRPTIDVRDAQVRAFGTPDITPQQTWFRSAFIRGEDDGWPNYHSFRVTCYDNPWMPIETIHDAARNMTRREFRMLYLAEWVDEEGQVFRDWETAMLAAEPTLRSNGNYLLAVDFGLRDDFTVVLLGDASTRTAVRMWRWNQTASREVYDQIEDLWREYGQPPIVADASGIGLPMIESLRERGMRRVDAVTITAANKLEMVGRLAADIEHRRIMFPPWESLIREIKAFVYHQTPSGQLKASAASGYNDDTVMALLLLNEGFHRRRSSGQQPYSYLDARMALV